MMRDMFNVEKNVLTGIVLFALCGAYAWLSKPKMVEATIEYAQPVERQLAA